MKIINKTNNELAADMFQPDLKWAPISNETKYRAFQLGEDPVIIHIIKTGFVDRYLIVWEDAYEQMLGDCYTLNKQEIKDQFDIELDI